MGHARSRNGLELARLGGIPWEFPDPLPLARVSADRRTFRRMGPAQPSFAWRALMYRRIEESIVRDVLRRWQAGESLRTIARATAVDRKTVRRYVRVAEAIRLAQHAELDDETVVAIVAVVRQPTETVTELQFALACKRADIRASLAARVSLAAVHAELLRLGIQTSYATLRRFAIEECGWRVRESTPRKAA